MYCADYIAVSIQCYIVLVTYSQGVSFKHGIPLKINKNNVDFIGVTTVCALVV